MPKSEFREGYVDAYYPNLCGYAYQAEIVSVGHGRSVMNKIMKGVDWIQEDEYGRPVILHMRKGFVKPGTNRVEETLFVDDTDDFPQPTDQCD